MKITVYSYVSGSVRLHIGTVLIFYFFTLKYNEHHLKLMGIPLVLQILKNQNYS